jgi:CHAT domain-containing protein
VKEAALTHDVALEALLDHQAVHFATHGIYDDHAPLFSALVTSPAAGQAARVSLYELTGIQLKAKLVVLSACESGTGKLRQGDEISGLARTILSAGAKTVIASLWDVDDASTALLMQQFYAGLHKGQAPAAALRSAALAVRKNKMYQHPRYWAPFVVTGAF